MTLPLEGSTEQTIHSKACLWTGIYRVPDTESLASVIRVDLIELKGVDMKDNYVAIGEGVNPENESSVLFNHSNIHLHYDFFLERVNIRDNSCWIQIHQRKIDVTFYFSISLAEEGKFIQAG